MATSKRRKKRILDDWNHRCVICGEGFVCRACMTREHLIPRSIAKGLQDNLAPSHYNCNKFRKTMPIIDAILLIEEKRKKMGEKQFKSWISKKVPNSDKHSN